ncbi:unnamed protein product [Hymenolepis diminuta]|nr:unnamed protein product [Hymenolepis diminuta]
MKQKNSSHAASPTAKATENLTSNNGNYTQWITDELLSQVSSDPEISAWLQNPEKMSLLNNIKTNLMELITSKNTKDKMVIQKISGILAEHFERLSVSQEHGESSETSIQTRKPLIEEVPSPEEEKVNSLLADENIRSALQDEEVHMIIETLRDNPEKGHQLAAQASKDVIEKIRLLVQKGVLAFR